LDNPRGCYTTAPERASCKSAVVPGLGRRANLASFAPALAHRS
jgi:hypothetical protein